MATSENLGRVRGAGLFFSTATSATTVALSTIMPNNISPLIGDSVVFGNGDIRLVQGIDSVNVSLSDVTGSFQGPQGATGATGPRPSFVYQAGVLTIIGG